MIVALLGELAAGAGLVLERQALLMSAAGHGALGICLLEQNFQQLGRLARASQMPCPMLLHDFLAML